MSESSTQASGAQSYRNRKVEAVYKQHEEEKKNKYLRHVLETEKCSFTPLVFSTHGGCAPEADKFHKQVATLLAKIFSTAKLSRM